jgi:uncharacterized membrane protein YhaH (DUF805 family)
MKNEVPLLIVIVTGIAIVVTFVIPHNPFGTLQNRLDNWYIIVLGFTTLLGMDSLIEYHLRRIRDRRKDSFYSVVLLLSFFVTFVLGIYSWIKFRSPLEPMSPTGWMYTYVLLPLQGTMFALLAFFITSAAYRAFRIKSLESTLLLVTACLVMLARVPIGNQLWAQFAHLVGAVIPGVKGNALAQSPVLSTVTNWLLQVPQMAAKRGINLGIALGTIAMSIRIILGIERSYMSS